MTLGPHPFVKIFTKDHDVGGLINNFYGSQKTRKHARMLTRKYR